MLYNLDVTQEYFYICIVLDKDFSSLAKEKTLAIPENQESNYCSGKLIPLADRRMPRGRVILIKFN